MMRGPGGKGNAQVAVSIPPASDLKGGDSSSSSSMSAAATPSATNPLNAKKGPNLIQGLFRLAQGVTGAPVPLEIDNLKCCLTFVNVSWQSIVSDVNSYVLKK